MSKKEQNTEAIKSSLLLLETEQEQYQTLGGHFDKANRITRSLYEAMLAFRQVPYILKENGELCQITNQHLIEQIEGLGIDTTEENLQLLKTFSEAVLEPKEAKGSSKFIAYLRDPKTTAGQKAGKGRPNTLNKRLSAIESQTLSVTDFVKSFEKEKGFCFSPEELAQLGIDFLNGTKTKLEILEEEKRRSPNAGEEAAKELMRKGCFPCFPSTDGELYKSCWLLMLRRFKSWKECDQNYRQENQDLADKIASLTEALSDDSGLTKTFREFVNSCDAQNNFLGRNFSKNFKKLFAKIRDKGLRSVENDNLYPILKILFENYEPLINPELFSTLWSIYKLEQKLAKRRDNAYVTLPSEHSLVNPEFDDKNVEISVGANGNFEFFFGQNLKGGKVKSLLETPIRVSARPSGYFLNPEIVKLEDRYRLVFTKGNSRRETVTADVKSVRLRKKKNRFYIELTYREQISEDRRKTWNLGFDARAYFSTSLGNDKHEGEDYLGLKALAVDLNQSPLAACSIFEIGRTKTSEDACEIPGMGFANVVERDIILGGETIGLKDEIVRLSKEAREVVFLIRCHKDLRNGRELREKTLDSFSNLERKFGLTPVRNTDGQEQRYRSKDELGLLVGRIKRDFQALKTPFCAKPHLCVEMFYMLDLLENLKSLTKSWNRYTKDLWDGIKDGESSRYRRARKNLGDDMVKKMCFSLVDVCLKNGASVIILENLDFQDSEDRHFNRMNQTWSMLKIKDRLLTYAKPYGIVVTEVDKRGTSRRDPVTDQVGYRDAFTNKGDLLVNRKGEDGVWEQLKLNADSAASVNIGKVFFSRHKLIHSFEAIKVSETLAVVRKSESAETGKRFKAFLKNNGFGDKHPCLRSDGSNFWEASFCSKEEYQDALSSLHRKSKVKFYPYWGKFIDEETNREKNEAIKFAYSGVTIGDVEFEQYYCFDSLTIQARRHPWFDFGENDGKVFECKELDSASSVRVA